MSKTLFPDTTKGKKWPIKDTRPQSDRDATRDALKRKGMLRKKSTKLNDIEKINLPKPKDIGDPERIPGSP